MTQAEIYQDMLAFFEEETGYEIGTTGDLAVRFQAAAAQLMALYHYGDYIYRQAFPQTAQEESLDLHGQRRGLARLEERKATGTLRFSISSPLAAPLGIEQGTICLSSEGTAFETVDSGIILAGSTSADIAAQAVEPGPQGNAVAKSITVMQTPPDGVELVTNPQRFSGGRSRETDEDYRSRILESYKGLNNGTNAAFYRELALSVDGIDGVSVVPQMNGAGSVGLLVTSDSGKVSQGALDKLDALLEQRRELGITVVVQEPENVVVTVKATILPAEGYSVSQAKTVVEQALGDYIGSLALGKTLYKAALCSKAMSTGAIDNIVFTKPAADMTPEAGQRLLLGTITLEEI